MGLTHAIGSLLAQAIGAGNEMKLVKAGGARRRSGNRYSPRALIEGLESRVLLSVTVNSALDFDAMDGNALYDADLTHNGTLVISGDLTIQDGGSINANDTGIPNANAHPPIVINVSGNLIIQADSGGARDTGIFAENRNQGGTGANITLTVGGNFSIANGATISAADVTVGGNPAGAGNITMNVTGTFDMTGSSKIDASAANGAGGAINLTSAGTFTMINSATITSDGAASQSSGDINIHVLNGDFNEQTGTFITAGQLNTSSTGPGGDISIITEIGNIDIDGSVLTQRAGLTGTGASQATGGGAITIIAGAQIDPSSPNGDPIGADLLVSDTGVISSSGGDAGGDLVHLEGCEVTIWGYVESTGSGHALPNDPASKLNDPNDPTIPLHPNHPGSATAAIEVWAGTHGISIDSVLHNGQLNADLTAGNSNRSWIDLFARGDISINGQPPATGTYFSVHATNAGNTPTGGQIDIRSTEGSIIATGLAINASAQTAGLITPPDGNAAGGNGGAVFLTALNNINLDGATINARGDDVPTLGNGGTISVRSSTGAISWQGGVGDVRPTGQDLVGPDTGVPPANRGVITLQAATTVTVTGTSFPYVPPNSNTAPTTPTILALSPSAAPTVPSYVHLPTCNFGGPGPLFDFGDAPENPIVPGDYPTTLANNGARHVIVQGFNLGAIVDAETDGQPNGFATGDDLAGVPDDEDGVTFNGPFVPGLSTSITVTLTNTAGLAFPVLNAFFDWNGDGDWLDAGEQVFTDQALVSGTNNLTVNVPLNAVVSVAGAPIFARFRLSTKANAVTPTGISSTGQADNGEVEDYKLQIFPYWTSKCAVITQVGCFVIPDVLVDVDNGPVIFDATKVGTLAPATKSIQAAIDYVNAHGGDLNGDGVILVAVTAKDTLVVSAACGGIPFVGRELGGDGTENFIVTNPFSQLMNVAGNSVTIHALDKTKPVATLQNSVGKLTYLDIHVADSNVDGMLVQNNASYVLVKNTEASFNKGAGIHIIDNNVEVRGSQRIFGNGIGICVEGDNNLVETINSVIDNTVVGIKITGNNNEASDIDVGLSGHGNAAGVLVNGNNNKIADGTIAYNNGYGIKVASGTGNNVTGNDVLSNKGTGICVTASNTLITSNDLFLNTGDGINVTGNSNQIKQNNVGDKSKGNGGDGLHIAGNLNLIDKNGIYNNFGDGLELIGDNNTVSNNIVGDKSKGGNGQGNVAGNRDGIRITGKTNLLDSNTVNANKGYGFYVALGTSTGNKFKNNKSNTDSAGGAQKNILAQYKFDATIVDQGGNKRNNVSFTLVAPGTYT